MKKVLVISSSLGAFFKQFSTSYSKTNGDRVCLDTISAHGAAFWQGDSIECSENGVINFKNGIGGARNEKIPYTWRADFEVNSSTNEGISLSILDYDHVFFLDGTFVSRHAYRRELVDHGYVCSAIGTPELRKKLFDHYKSIGRKNCLISSALCWGVYKQLLQLNIKLFSFLRDLGISDRAIIVPHVIPPQRTSFDLYRLYNLYEQQFLAKKIKQEFGILSLDIPSSTYQKCGEGISCLDEYHQPAPDHHHASPKWYSVTCSSFLDKCV